MWSPWGIEMAVHSRSSGVPPNASEQYMYFRANSDSAAIPACPLYAASPYYSAGYGASAYYGAGYPSYSWLHDISQPIDRWLPQT
jgi:hypothetical protein